MPPTDNYGSLPLPATTPAGGTDAGDPTLTKVAAYFKAVLNQNVKLIWESLEAVGAPVVANAYVTNPEDAPFNEADLPTLFLYRLGSDRSPEWIAEDFRIFPDQLRVVWVYPTANQEVQNPRSPLVNAIVKALDDAIERGRDPSWVDSGDADPQASTHGSVLHLRANLWSIKITRWSSRKVTIDVDDDLGPRRDYAAVEILMDIEERDVWGNPPATNGVSGTITSPTSDQPSPATTDQFLLT